MSISNNSLLFDKSNQFGKTKNPIKSLHSLIIIETTKTRYNNI